MWPTLFILWLLAWISFLQVFLLPSPNWVSFPPTPAVLYFTSLLQHSFTNIAVANLLVYELGGSRRPCLYSQLCSWHFVNNLRLVHKSRNCTHLRTSPIHHSEYMPNLREESENQASKHGSFKG